MRKQLEPVCVLHTDGVGRKKLVSESSKVLNMSFVLKASLLAVCAGALLSGCAASMPRPIQTDAALGRVVVYRNGVAYFERRAVVHGDRFALEVPAERLDDFLKSLSVVDARTGNAVPISFPTLEHAEGMTTVMVNLPKAGDYDLRISYVTESPAWKPTYRLQLKDNGPAELQSWAVVDNVSGEDWTKVAVGVGSTSALSFKYDLQSVRYVERETLSDTSELGLAPPPGGSSYAVASKEVRVLGNFGADAVDDLKKADSPAPKRAPRMSGGSGRAMHDAAAAAAPEMPVDEEKPSVRGPMPAITRLAAQLKGNQNKVKVLGYARASDKDSAAKSLERANSIRDQLLESGVRADQVEVVATGQVSSGDGVRIVAADSEGPKPVQGKSATETNGDAPLGSAYFLAPSPLTIEKGHSAMVSMLTAQAQAKDVYFYDPISSRGSKKYAFRSVLLQNPTHHTLDAGPVTVYEGGQFLGEGLSDAILPDSRAFVPFALDRKLIVDTEQATREQIDRLVTIERGIVHSEARSIRTTKLSLANRDGKAATVYVRHPITEGFKLEAPATGVEKLGGAYLFAVNVPANESVNLSIEESTPMQKSLDIRTESGIGELGLYLHSASKLEPELARKLSLIVERHRAMVELDERLVTIQAQSNVYRERIEEINAQLVSLRRVAQASELSRHLAKKMEEISQRLQKATIDAADLEAKRLTERVAMEDQLSELTLENRKEVALRN
ncbi:MAG TPA: OmpA family protein [Polyangiaceae bacterium]|nr:OmpA family protein [Polyangiaceae bacterium]